MGDSKQRLLTLADLITLLLVIVVVLYLMPAGDRLKYQQVVADLTRVFNRTEPVVSTGVDVSVPEEAPGAPPAQAASHQDRVIPLVGSAYFASGSAEILPEMASLLEDAAKQLAGIPNQVRLEGYSDNVPILNGAYRSNQELSVARAVQVQAFLEQRGIARARLTVVGYGERNPAASNDTPEGRARNRRVDVVVLPGAPVQEIGSLPE